MFDSAWLWRRCALIGRDYPPRGSTHYSAPAPHKFVRVAARCCTLATPVRRRPVDTLTCRVGRVRLHASAAIGCGLPRYLAATCL